MTGPQERTPSKHPVLTAANPVRLALLAERPGRTCRGSHSRRDRRARARGGTCSLGGKFSVHSARHRAADRGQQRPSKTQFSRTTGFQGWKLGPRAGKTVGGKSSQSHSRTIQWIQESARATPSSWSGARGRERAGCRSPAVTAARAGRRVPRGGCALPTFLGPGSPSCSRSRSPSSERVAPPPVRAYPLVPLVACLSVGLCLPCLCLSVSLS